MSSANKVTKDTRTREFIDITGASSGDAQRFLKGTSWRLDTALDAFYNDPLACKAAELSRERGKGGDATRNLEKLWDHYRDLKSPAETDFDGTEKYCRDLKIDPSDVVFMALAWLTQAQTMPRLSKQGFVDGWKQVGKDTIESQRDYITHLRSGLKNPDTFRKVYNFTFDYAKEAGQKSMQLEIASELWNLLIPLDPDSTFPAEHLAMWQGFLVARGSKAVSKDTWTLFLEFTRTIDPAFVQHDEEAAWPSLIDDFVDHARRTLAGGVRTLAGGVKMDVA